MQRLFFSVILLVVAASARAGEVDRLYVIDCGWAHATDQSRWSPGINAGVPIDLSDNCYLIHHSSEGYLLWDTGITDRLAALPEGQTVPAQGRVRSDNIAARQHDGLLFRSRPEILFYDALKKAGIPFAPLSVVLRGGVQYNRIEPDFVIYKDGIMMIVEIDGDLYHSETPAAAHARRSVRGAGVTLRFRASSQWTRCWREMDSNPRSPARRTTLFQTPPGRSDPWRAASPGSSRLRDLLACRGDFLEPWQPSSLAHYGLVGVSGTTAGTPSGLMLKARKVNGSLPGLPHW